MTIRLGRGEDIFEGLKILTLSYMLSMGGVSADIWEDGTAVSSHGASGADVMIPARHKESGRGQSPHGASGADIMIPARHRESGTTQTPHSISGADVYVKSTRYVETGTVTTTHAVSGADVFNEFSELAYRAYTALLSQAGTSAPSAIVISNNLFGEVVWSRSAVGQYLGTLSLGSFDHKKTFVIIGVSSKIGALGYSMLYAGINNAGSIDLVSASVEIYGPGYSSIGQYDNILSNTPIEIRVYSSILSIVDHGAVSSSHGVSGADVKLP